MTAVIPFYCYAIRWGVIIITDYEGVEAHLFLGRKLTRYLFHSLILKHNFIGCWMSFVVQFQMWMHSSNYMYVIGWCNTWL